MHDHSHSHGHSSVTVLRYSLVATFIYVLVTLVAGLRAHSLALLSEAGHNVTDLLALLLSWVAIFIQTRPPSATKTFGYHRAGVLAAFVNALTLVLIAFYIFYEAFLRMQAPVAVQPRLMNWVDPALSIGIGCLILWSSLGIIRETLNILLEGTPRGISVEQIASSLTAVDGVNDVHDVHVWSIGSETHALSCHIGIADIPVSESEAILRRVKEVLAARFHIHHTTIQFENVVCEIAHGCVIPVSPQHHHER